MATPTPVSFARRPRPSPLNLTFIAYDATTNDEEPDEISEVRRVVSNGNDSTAAGPPPGVDREETAATHLDTVPARNAFKAIAQSAPLARVSLTDQMQGYYDDSIQQVSANMSAAPTESLSAPPFPTRASGFPQNSLQTPEPPILVSGDLHGGLNFNAPGPATAFEGAPATVGGFPYGPHLPHHTFIPDQPPLGYQHGGMAPAFAPPMPPATGRPAFINGGPFIPNRPFPCTSTTPIHCVCDGDPQPPIADLNRALDAPETDTLRDQNRRKGARRTPLPPPPARLFLPAEWSYAASWPEDAITTTNPMTGLAVLSCPGSQPCTTCGERAGHNNTLVISIAINHPVPAHRTSNPESRPGSGYSVSFGRANAQPFDFALDYAPQPDPRRPSTAKLALDAAFHLLSRVRAILADRRLATAPGGTHVIIRTTSAALVQGVTKHVSNWEARDWKVKHGRQEIHHAALWRRLVGALRGLRGDFECMVWFWEVSEGEGDRVNRPAGDGGEGTLN